MEEIRWINNYDNVRNRLIGRNGKGYLTLRLLIENIVSIQNDIKEANRLYESEKTKILINHNATARGIEELGYKTYMTILQNKHDEAMFALNRFMKVSIQIPQFGGEISCLLDYILNGIKWVCTEIQSHTIETRLSKENCIAYVKEAEKLIGRRFNNYVYRN